MTASSTFALRFEFARARQHALGTWREDQVLAEHLGVAPSRIAEYKTRQMAPSSERTLAIAVWCDVDPGWLAFGEASAAPGPDGFDRWLQNRASHPRGAKLEEPPIPAPRRGAAKRSKGA